MTRTRSGSFITGMSSGRSGNTNSFPISHFPSNRSQNIIASDFDGLALALIARAFDHSAVPK
jgi:hypothetical protein